MLFSFFPVCIQFTFPASIGNIFSCLLFLLTCLFTSLEFIFKHLLRSRLPLFSSIFFFFFLKLHPKITQQKMLSLQEGEFLSTSISSLVPGFCSMLQYFVAVCTEAGGGRSTLCACRLRGDSLDKRPPYLGQGKSGPGTHQQGHSRPRSSSHVLKCFGIQYKVNDPFLSLRLFGLRSEAWRCPGPASSCGCMSGANYFIWMHAMRQLLYLDAYHVPTTSFGCLSGKKKTHIKSMPSASYFI